MINILGIDVDNKINLDDLELRLRRFLESEKQNYIVTPNPEIILKAQEDEELFYILNNANLSLADGFGLKVASFFSRKKLKRVTGADALVVILRLAENNGKKVLIINNKNGLSSSDEIKEALKKDYPDLKFIIKDHDSHDYKIKKEKLVSWNYSENNILGRTINKIGENINKKLDYFNKNKIDNFLPDILICNFGAPHQEKFIYHNLPKIPSVRVAIGIGGGLDFLTKKIKRAPIFMRKIGLEWLWRLIKQPSRYRRIYKAVFVFTYKFLKWKFISPYLYRKNVACLLYKKKSQDLKALKSLKNYDVLLVERSEEPGHWQIPQGGIDNNTIRRAGSREINEELGITNFSPKKIYKNVFKYESDKKGRYGFKGQKQSLLIAEFKGSDDDISLNFWDHSGWRWVNATELTNEVHPIRKKGMKIFLEKFNDYINFKK
jgi:N-acetylglucosaminyldiphosphoundecaprenol N-acetyl-beta-D-mannosaminyltransferase